VLLAPAWQQASSSQLQVLHGCCYSMQRPRHAHHALRPARLRPQLSPSLFQGRAQAGLNELPAAEPLSPVQEGGCLPVSRQGACGQAGAPPVFESCEAVAHQLPPAPLVCPSLGVTASAEQPCCAGAAPTVPPQWLAASPAHRAAPPQHSALAGAKRGREAALLPTRRSRAVVTAANGHAGEHHHCRRHAPQLHDRVPVLLVTCKRRESGGSRGGGGLGEVVADWGRTGLSWPTLRAGARFPDRAAGLAQLRPAGRRTCHGQHQHNGCLGECGPRSCRQRGSRVCGVGAVQQVVGSLVLRACYLQGAQRQSLRVSAGHQTGLGRMRVGEQLWVGAGG